MRFLFKDSDLKPRDHDRYSWFVRPPHETSFEDAIKEEAWRIVSPERLTPGSVVEILPLGNPQWYAKLIVLEKHGPLTKFGVLQKVDFPASPAKLKAEQASESKKAPAGYTITYRGAEEGFAVVESATRKIAKSGFSDKASAQAWLNEHAEAKAA